MLAARNFELSVFEPGLCVMLNSFRPDMDFIVPFLLFVCFCLPSQRLQLAFFHSEALKP